VLLEQLLADHVSATAEVGRLRELREFDDADREAALAERFARECDTEGRHDLEIVLLGAPSEEALRRTHSRYFKSAREQPCSI
jgi:chloramphenicol 3-O-phosphotransferase